MLFLLQVGGLPNQGPNGLQLGAASRMLEVTDCGTAVHHVQDMHQVSTLRDYLLMTASPTTTNTTTNHPKDRPAGRAACKWAYSHYFPEQPPTSQQPGARLMTR